MDYYLPGAEPYFFSGDSVGCLLLHGFCSSPGETRWLGEHLAAQGWTVCGVRTAGHGTDYRTMARLGWQDWYGSLLDGYHLLQQHCDRVFIAGHSMGGMLALLAGAALPLDGLLILATPLILRQRLLPYVHLLKYIRPFYDASDHSDLPQVMREEQARRGETVRGRIRYDTWSSHAVAQLYVLSKAARAALHQVSAPLCLIYSTADSTAPPENQDLIAGAVASTIIETHCLERSGHNLPIDIERETVFDLAAEFIQRRIEAGHS